MKSALLQIVSCHEYRGSSYKNSASGSGVHVPLAETAASLLNQYAAECVSVTTHDVSVLPLRRREQERCRLYTSACFEGLIGLEISTSLVPSA